jgi:ADP-ribose pyrophosphatase
MPQHMTPIDAHLVETTISSQAVLKGSFLNAYRDEVRLPGGAVATREYFKHPGAVVVIAQLDAKPDASEESASSQNATSPRYLMERQYRYPVAQVMTEFPAGKLDPGEDPLRCAQRELLEETGYSAREWAYAGKMHLAIAYCDEIIHIYFARGLSFTAQQLDEDEHLEVFDASLDELLSWAQSGQITDAKTMTCLTWLQQVASGAWSLNWQAIP